MEFLAGWPEWVIWCVVGVAASLAVAAVVYVIETALEMGRH